MEHTLQSYAVETLNKALRYKNLNKDKKGERKGERFNRFCLNIYTG
jgi:hypothetical protein